MYAYLDKNYTKTGFRNMNPALRGIIIIAEKMSLYDFDAANEGIKNLYYANAVRTAQIVHLITGTTLTVAKTIRAPCEVSERLVDGIVKEMPDCVLETVLKARILIPQS